MQLAVKLGKRCLRRCAYKRIRLSQALGAPHARFTKDVVQTLGALQQQVYVPLMHNRRQGTLGKVPCVHCTQLAEPPARLFQSSIHVVARLRAGALSNKRP